MKKCAGCSKPKKELCSDDRCKECHVSCSWEDCTDGTWNARMLLSTGHPREEVKWLYPEARI
jgi:hypothetical protein